MYILAAFAQLERETTAERVADGMTNLAIMGCWTGGKLPSGMKSTQLVVNGKKHSYLLVIVNIVTVDVEEYAKIHFEKAVKKTLTIPAWLNTAALEQNINFSQVLQEALKAKLNLR